MIALILGWLATFFRAFGMICKNTNSVKKWVTLGNLAWMLNGILTHNVPLVVCNLLCVIVMVYDYLKQHKCI